MKYQNGGVNTHDKKKATYGYTLFAPTRHDNAYLIDMDGQIVNKWALINDQGINRCQLTNDGHLFIAEGSKDGPPLSAGKGGWLREYDWNGKMVWEHHDEDQHHDARRLPNGNTVYIAWEPLDEASAKRVQGGIPGTEKEGIIYGDVIREITPDKEIVWEWRTQEMDIEKYPICPLCPRAEFAHCNTVSPLPNGDVLLSFRVLNTILIVDRQTRKIKWEHTDLSFGHQHDCHFLDNGNILLFCNGFHGRDVDMASSVREFDPETGDIIWEYKGNPYSSFFSANISGAQRLRSGNTLICEGYKGCLFEVTPEGKIVWEYVNSYTAAHPVFGNTNWIFRAYRYAPDAPHLMHLN